MKRAKQTDIVLDYLKRHGTITTRKAVTELNIMSLPKRIEELRRMGYAIRMDWAKTESGARYGVYTLMEV